MAADAGPGWARKRRGVLPNYSRRRPFQIRAPRKSRGCLGTSPEVDPRHLLRLLRRLEVLLRVEAERLGVEHGREALDEGVVGADGVVVAHALDRDPVLGAGQLVGEAGELLVRLEIGVALGDGEQPPERTAELTRGVDLLVA